MAKSWIKQANQFKSSLSVIAGFLLRSRETQAARAKSRTQEIQQLKKFLEQQERINREQQRKKTTEMLHIARPRKAA